MKQLRDEKGQSMVEFALVLPVLILVVFGIIDFGWLFFNKLAIENGAREGARYAAVQAAEQSITAMQTDVEERVAPNISVAHTVTISQRDMDIDADGTDDIKYVTVQVEADVPLLTPIIGAFFTDNQCHMSSIVEMHVEQIIT